ncbi:MAG: fibronectin type III domain-containing protein, partial [Candidatus Latescibacterota bacterium]
MGEFRTQSRPQKPAFNGGPVAEADESSATITWTTNVPSNSIVDVGVDGGYGLHIEQADLVLDHEVVIKNLDPGTVYHYKVTSIDLSGNVLSTDPNGLELHSRDLTVRTLAAADVDPPKLVANPTTDEASTSRLEWEALGKGVSGFVEDNQLLFAHALTLTGLQPRTLYAVRVISEDAVGNAMVWEPTASGKAAAKRAYAGGLRTTASGKVAQPPGGGGLFVTDSF